VSGHAGGAVWAGCLEQLASTIKHSIMIEEHNLFAQHGNCFTLGLTVVTHMKVVRTQKKEKKVE